MSHSRQILLRLNCMESVGSNPCRTISVRTLIWSTVKQKKQSIFPEEKDVCWEPELLEN